jgi:hypothetical protein
MKNSFSQPVSFWAALLFTFSFSCISYGQSYHSYSGVFDSLSLDKLHKHITECTGETYPADQKIAIVYYSEKDECSASSVWTQDKAYIKMSTTRLDAAIKKMGGTSLIYLYKNNEGLEQHKGIIEWHFDKNHQIEELFFAEKHPCTSFAIIAPSGNYYTYQGAYADAQIIEALTIIK